MRGADGYHITNFSLLELVIQNATKPIHHRPKPSPVVGEVTLLRTS